jgi:hypothetical protein
MRLCGIGHRKQIIRDVGRRQRVRFRSPKALSFIVESNDAKDVAQPFDQRLTQSRISTILAHLLSLRPGHRLWINWQQQGRSRACNLDLDGASVM